jgi:hypothetical protein
METLLNLQHFEDNKLVLPSKSKTNSPPINSLFKQIETDKTLSIANVP